MTVQPANIGRPRLEVRLLARSPFNGVPRQEWGYYFTPEMLASMSPDNIEALPPPFNGYRNKEKLFNYDNFIHDGDEYLEFTKINQKGIDVPIDTSALGAYNSILKLRGGSIDSTEKSFFTWQIYYNFFGKTTPAPTISGDATTNAEFQASIGASATTGGANPPPAKFKDAYTSNENVPKWTYVQRTTPNGFGQVSALSPTMTATSKNSKKPIHWGCSMQKSLARNQPFELLFFHQNTIHSLAEESPSLAPRFAGIDVDLTKKAYFAIEIGRNSKHHFILLFVQDFAPRCYSLSGNNQKRQATLVSEFTEFSGEKLFNQNNDVFTVKVEPVAAGLLVSSNQFESKKWVIQGSGTNPFFIGESPLAIYSGNVQAGFLFRPVQYEPLGKFTTPRQTVVQLSSQTDTPTSTTAIKGLGDTQQNQSTGSPSDPDPVSGGEVHAVDSEKVNGKNIVTFIQNESESKEKPLQNGNRNIILKVIEEANPNNGQDPAYGPAGSDANVKKRTFQTEVTLRSTDLEQGGGYVVTNGRSPYIWQIRSKLPANTNGVDPGEGEDISCDVLGCDLSWNATSYNELSHNGTLKILNRPSVSGRDYRQYTNRAIYFKIKAWWEGGAGHDPGGSGRQVFEGLSVGATVDTKAERETVTFKLEDYMTCLQGGKFILSPYYDGMNASKAVRDIIRQLGLGDSRILSGNKQIAQNNDPKDFVLPFANPFDEPQFRFKDGSSYKEAVIRIATLDGKVAFFDHLGNFHYDPIPGGIMGDENTNPVADFYTSPKRAPEGKYVVWNMSSFTRAVADTYNVFQVSTVDKETGALIHLADAHEEMIFDPSAEGYLGFRKHLLIREPALGSVEAAGKYFFEYNSRIFIPPLTLRFETYGYSGIKPLDTISLDGQKGRVMNLSLHINKEEMTYWMNIEGEWYFSSGKGQNPNLNAAAGGGVSSGGSPGSPGE